MLILNPEFFSEILGSQGSWKDIFQGLESQGIMTKGLGKILMVLENVKFLHNYLPRM